ncbi:hypothetical protein ACVME8_002146 [Bradyrhizobium diazoefficiens]
MRTRRAANRALSRPFVPLRQLTVFHLALASICSAAIDKISGTWCFRGLPRTLVIGQMSFTSTGYTFWCRGIPTAQASPRSVSPCRNGALRPYPASASTHPKRMLAAIARSISAKAISGLDRGVRCSIGTRARFKVSDVRVPFAKVWRGDCSLLINVFANRWRGVWRRQRRRITRCGRTTRAGARRSGTAGDRLRSL